MQLLKWLIQLVSFFLDMTSFTFGTSSYFPKSESNECVATLRFWRDTLSCYRCSLVRQRMTRGFRAAKTLPQLIH